MKKYILLASRIGSYIIDYILFMIVTYFLGKMGVYGYLLSLIIFFVYRYLMTAFFGATIGMIALKLTLDEFDKKRCLKREVFRFASAFYFIGYFYGIFDSLGRTFHDIASGTFVRYRDSKPREIIETFWVKIIIYIIFVISVTKWTTSFILNDIGNIGLKKICSSEEYFQSFDGDNLISYSQQELYLNTLGRKYIAVVDFGDKPSLVRIANKLKYTEVYKLNINNSKLTGEYAYKVNLPLQFICSGVFKDKLELCGISPNKDMVILDDKGSILGRSKVKLQKVLTVKCGDINNDGKAEIVVLGRNGDIEVFDYINENLTSIYNRKIGEDIIPQAFYIDKDIVVAAKGDNKSILYTYKFGENGFVYRDRKSINVSEISNINKANNDFILSNIYRNNMIFRVGNIQRFEMYAMTNKIKKLYNFGNRPARRYAYLVRNLEGVYDINNDGQKEIVLKAVGKEDVMGHGYVVEIYRFSKAGLVLNRVLTWINGVMSFKM